MTRSPYPLSIRVLADIAASRLISCPTAASCFLSNLCTAGRLLSARVQAGKAVQLGSHAGLQPPRVWHSPHWAVGHPLSQHPGEGTQGAPVPPHPACPLPRSGAWGCRRTAPFLFVPQETQQ